MALLVVLGSCGGKALSIEVTKQPSKAPQHGASITVGGKTLTLNKSAVEQIQAMRKAGATAYYPAFVPTRFSSVPAAPPSKDDDVDYEKKYPNYQVEFANKQGLRFTVESAYAGIGDGPDGDKTLTGNSKYFGKFDLYVFKPGSEGNATKNIYYITNWLSDKQGQAAGKNHTWPKTARHYHFLGHGVTDDEALKIVQSLQPITATSLH